MKIVIGGQVLEGKKEHTIKHEEVNNKILEVFSI